MSEAPRHSGAATKEIVRFFRVPEPCFQNYSLDSKIACTPAHLRVNRPCHYGLWLSLVERLVRDEEAVGSNPTSPIPPTHHVSITYYMSKPLAVGDKAPDFSTTAVGGEYGPGKDVSLADLKGSPVVLYFYPKDDTPGCTVQACGLRDHWNELADQAKIFGVSIDPADSHNAFISKYQLPFPLLSDPDHKMVNAYGVWVDKNMYGKKYKGTERSTFVIGPDGRIAAIFRKVKPEEHVDLLKEALSFN